jgi:hypothetical protein
MSTEEEQAWAKQLQERLAAQHKADEQAKYADYCAQWPGFEPSIRQVKLHVRECFDKSAISSTDVVEVRMHYGTSDDGLLTVGIWNSGTVPCKTYLGLGHCSGLEKELPLLLIAKEVKAWAESLGFGAGIRPKRENVSDGFFDSEWRVQRYVCIHIGAERGVVKNV